MSGQTPAQAAREAFIGGCVKRRITAGQVLMDPDGQGAGVWVETAQAAVEAARRRDEAPEPHPALELDLAGNEMTPGELDAVLATVPPCDEISPWGMRCRVVRAHEVHWDRDGNMWRPDAQPQAAPELAALRAALEDIRDAHEPGTHAHDTAHAALDRLDGLRAEPHPAPELAAAMAETGKVREAALVVLDSFTRASDGWRSRLSGVTLMRAYKAIGVPVPDHLKHLEGQ